MKSETFCSQGASQDFMSMYINRMRNANENKRLQNVMKERLRDEIKSRKVNELYEFMKLSQ